MEASTSRRIVSKPLLSSVSDTPTKSITYCKPKKYAPGCVGKIQIVDRDEAPPWLIWNPYLLTGFRIQLTIPDCFKSIFHLHNETVNIWTHIIATFLMPLFLIICLIDLSEEPLHIKIAFTISLLAGTSSYFTSALYHTVGCNSESTFDTFLQCDYAAIILSASATMGSSIYFGLQCYPHLQLFYTLVCVLLGLSVFCILVVPALLKLDQKTLDFIERIRFPLLIADFAYGLVPLIHWTTIYGLFSTVVYRVMISYVIVAIGFTFYYFKIPERWFLGTFDIWGNSHQIWHVFMFIGPCYQHSTSLAFLQHIHDNPCLLMGDGTL